MEALMDQISPFISLKMTNAGNFVPSAAAHNVTVKQFFVVVFSRAPVLALHMVLSPRTLFASWFRIKAGDILKMNYIHKYSSYRALAGTLFDLFVISQRWYSWNTQYLTIDL